MIPAQEPPPSRTVPPWREVSYGQGRSDRQHRIAVSEGNGSIQGTSRHRRHMRNTTAPDGHRHQEIWLAEAFRLAQPKRVHHQTDVLMLGCLPCGSPVAPPTKRRAPSRARKPSNRSLTRRQDHRRTSWIGSDLRSEGIGDAPIFMKRVRVSGHELGPSIAGT